MLLAYILEYRTRCFEPRIVAATGHLVCHLSHKKGEENREERLFDVDSNKMKE